MLRSQRGGGGAGEGGSEGNWSGVSKGDKEELRKKVLQKLDAYFACSVSKEVNYARLDMVSELHMFYLASKYYIFGFDSPCGLGGSFKSGKSIWIFDSASCSNQLESRSFLGRQLVFKRLFLCLLKPELLSLVPWKQCQKTRVFWIWSGQHLVRVSCPLDLHPISRVIKTLQEHQIMAPESGVSTSEGKMIHTFSIRAQGSKAAAIQLKENLEASLSKN
ncbi:hypothetical protein AHAS_Ahas16G0247200 [Arachis hypogaea]|uniref:Transcription factor n=1 Tax=Arachis hypogaea TaxID=3818 RepID=A0A444YSQ4_ARAHY|nr:hypothetical protein Ahy_B06g084756 [Arachis hypogaea]